MRTLVFFILVFAAFTIYTPSIHAPFTYEDEYEFLEVANGKRHYKTGVVHHLSFSDFQKKFIKLGRYAPSSMGIKYIKAKLFPKNSTANHIIVIAIAAVSSFLLFLIFLVFDVNFLLSLLGSMLYLFAPFATINIRLSTGESPGNLFLFLAILLFIRYIKRPERLVLWLAFIAVLLMSQAKESYTLLVPALAICYIVYYATFYQINIFESYKKTLKTVLFLFGIPLAIGVLGIILAIYSRGDVFAYGETKSYLAQALGNFVWLIKWLLPLIAFLFLSMHLFAKSNDTMPLFLATLVSMAWIGSQLVSYYSIKISFSQIRYLAPGSLIILFFSILALQFLFVRYKKIYLLALTVLVFMVAKYAKLAYIDAGLFKANAVAYNKGMDYIAKNKIQSVAFYQGFEIVISSYCQLVNRGYVPQIYASTTKLQKEENKEFNEYLLSILKNAFDVMEIDAIIQNKSNPQMLFISLPLPDNKDLPDKYVNQSFKEKRLFTEKYTNLKFSDLLNPLFYKGQLDNDSISYVTYIR